MLRVVCWKWKKHKKENFRYREEYTSKHVNIFANMIHRNLHIPHEVVCITDNPVGIDKNIRCVPIWDDLAKFGMCYRRLKIFSEEMADIIGPRFVSMDLDCVILNDITDILNCNDDFKIWMPKNSATPYCGSMFMMNAGAKRDIWEDFSQDQLILMRNTGGWGGGVKKRFIHKQAYDAGFKTGSDQAWISYKLYPHANTWTQEDGVFNFSESLYRKYRTGNKNIKNAKIVFFPGKHDPSHEKLYPEHPWIKKHWR